MLGRGPRWGLFLLLFISDYGKGRDGPELSPRGAASVVREWRAALAGCDVMHHVFSSTPLVSLELLGVYGELPVFFSS